MGIWRPQDTQLLLPRKSYLDRKFEVQVTSGICLRRGPLCVSLFLSVCCHICFFGCCFKAVFHTHSPPGTRLIFTYRGHHEGVLKKNCLGRLDWFFIVTFNSGRTQGPPPKKNYFNRSSWGPHQEASLGSPDWFLTRSCQVRAYTGFPLQKKILWRVALENCPLQLTHS